MQQSTIFAILMILLTRRKVSREYLAERFSISKRTVSRYLAVLEDAGIPLSSSTGVGGGVGISDDFMLDKTFFTEAEIIRIKAALGATADSFGDKVNQALAEKLDTLDKSRAQDEILIKQDNLYIDCEYAQAASLRPKINTLSEAIDKVRAVEIKYTDAHGYVSFRTIEPYTLVFKNGTWYIYAMCRLRGDFRLFRLSRISDMRMTSKRFIKYDSKLVEKLGLEYYNELFVDLEFEFYPSVSDSVVEWLGMSAVTERGTKFVASAELPMTSSLVKKLLAFGSSVKVIKPQELADRIREEAERMLSTYKKPKK